MALRRYRAADGRRFSRGRHTRKRRRRLLPALLFLLLLVALAFAVVLGVRACSLYHKKYSTALEYPDIIAEAAVRHNVDPYLVCAIIRCESSWNPDAVSSAGAIGLMQLLEDTCASVYRLGYTDLDPQTLLEPHASSLSDPATNIEYGCAYLEFLYANLESTDEIICAYNAGIGNVSSWIKDGISIPDSIPFAETRSYWEKVTAAYDAYREAYPDGIGG